VSFIGDDSTQARRLHRAQLIAGVSHPNLVRLVPRSGGGYSTALAGAQLLSHFGSSSAPFRRFELEHAVGLLLDVLNGLGALHELVIDRQPFVHGSVSPEHICVDAHGQARLLPLSRWHSTAEAANEMNGYAAPEWLLGSQVDRRTDLFSVGVLL
jgi:serine/threonine protein kinase